VVTSCLFFGTPKFAISSLRALLESPYEIRAVVTRPDKPAGRGRTPRQSAVKEAAIAVGLEVLEPSTLKSQEAVAALASYGADFFVVAAYGTLVPPRVLELPRAGVLNIHPSLLPRYRGASPIQAAILAGDDITGVTIMLMDEGLDTGPILAQITTNIGANESAGELSDRLSELAAVLLIESIESWLAGNLEPRPQQEDLSSYVGQVSKADAEIDWTRDGQSIWRMVRAYNPWPGAATSLADARLQIWEAWPGSDESLEEPGTVLSLAPVSLRGTELPALHVKCGSGTLAVLRLQKEGRRPLNADDFARGERGLVGQVLGSASRRPGR
jgi:methionyl-tRNA formyltransferase